VPVGVPCDGLPERLFATSSPTQGLGADGATSFTPRALAAASGSGAAGDATQPSPRR
jgi:hypothetical protein